MATAIELMPHDDFMVFLCATTVMVVHLLEGQERRKQALQERQEELHRQRALRRLAKTKRKRVSTFALVQEIPCKREFEMYTHNMYLWHGNLL